MAKSNLCQAYNYGSAKENYLHYNQVCGCVVVITTKEVICLLRFVCWFVCLSVGLLKNLWVNFSELLEWGGPWTKNSLLEFRAISVCLFVCVCVCYSVHS